MGWFWLTSYGNAGFRRLPLPVLVQNGIVLVCGLFSTLLWTFCGVLWCFVSFFCGVVWTFSAKIKENIYVLSMVLSMFFYVKVISMFCDVTS